MKCRALLLGILLTAGVALSAETPLQSHWLPDNLRIDGMMADWPVQTFVSKEVATSVVNDGQNIYVLVATSDRAVNQQLKRAGLAVYLDPKGGKSQAFGIRIPPIGERLSAGNAPAGAQEDEPILTYFHVLGPDSDEAKLVDLAEPTGIDLRIGSEHETFFLELKVPMNTGSGHPYAPGIRLDKGEFGLGIVTPDPQRVARVGRGGRGGRGGGGFSGGGPGGPPPDKGKAIDIWTKVTLAKAR